jgi:hypothetical protein
MKRSTRSGAVIQDLVRYTPKTGHLGQTDVARAAHGPGQETLASLVCNSARTAATTSSRLYMGSSSERW